MSQPMTPLEDPNEDQENNTKGQQIQPEQQQQRYHLQSINSTIVIRHVPSQGLSFQIWPAATTLVNLLDRHVTAKTTLFSSSSGSRLRILELGSGTGVVGIATAALLGANVTVTDLPHVLPNLQFNADANAGVLELNGGTVNVAALSWGDTQNMEVIGRQYDVILGSDVVYYDHLYEPLLETLKFFLLGSERKLVCVMGHLKRWKKESAFFKKAKKCFDVEVLHTDSPCDGSRIGVTVYQFVSKSAQKLNSQQLVK